MLLTAHHRNDDFAAMISAVRPFRLWWPTF